MDCSDRSPLVDCGQDVPGWEEFPLADTERPLGARFEAVAARHPHRPAVRTRTAQLSYAELDHAANRIAHAVLEREGPGEGSVAALLPGDAVSVAAFLGLLKAGKRLVPIDPALPAARAATVLADSEARLLLTDGAHAAAAHALAASRAGVLDLDARGETTADGAPGIEVPLDRHTWIVYTSGSTGQPKGVLQSHRNLIWYTRVYANALRLSPEDRLVTLFPLSVNGGLHDLLMTLLTGGCFCPWNATGDGIPGAIPWLVEQRATIYSSVPTAFRHLVRALTGRERFPSLRLLRLWGEPAYRRDFDAYVRHFPDSCRLVNRLGASETGPVRWAFHGKDLRFSGNNLPVGTAAEGTTCDLIDTSGAPVRQGEVGEVVAGGAYLSPGYWRRPDATATAFSDEPGAGGMRRYRTGDLAALQPDGTLVHMGRRDFQVKIRGHRIELDEIEQSLLGLRGVHEAAVHPRADAGGDLRLVAYVVSRALPPPTVSALRSGLAATLPDHMVPSGFVFLDAMPLAPNGKVARGALPAPDGGRPVLDVSYRAPASDLERELAAIWQEVLGIAPIGADDEFLDLGGHSLLATQLLARLLPRFRVEIPLGALLSASTVARMAVTLEGAHGSGASDPKVAALMADIAGLGDGDTRSRIEADLRMSGA